MSQQPPPQPPQQYQMQPSIPGAGMGIASLVLGIISLVTFCVPVLGVVAIILGIVSIVQAGNAPTGKAKAGIVMGFIAIVVCAVFWSVLGWGARKGGDILQQKAEELKKEADKAQNDPKYQQQLKDLGDKLSDAVKKAQDDAQKAKDANTPTNPNQPPSVMLTHPDGWSIYIA